MAVSGNYSQISPKVESAISNEQEFYEKYSLTMDQDTISVKDKVSNLVIKKYETIKSQEQYISDFDPTHFWDGIYYFVLSSAKYAKAKYVYSYGVDTNHVKCLLSPVSNPHFFQNRLIEFGSGFTVPGPQYYNYTGEGVIRVFELSKDDGKPGKIINEIKKYIVKDGGSGGWDGRIDEETLEITAFDYSAAPENARKTFPIFDKA